LWPNASECLFGLLVGLPPRAGVWLTQILALVNAFCGAGSLVFGVDHAVLPLLQVTAVRKDWMSNEIFRAVRAWQGYSAYLCGFSRRLDNFPPSVPGYHLRTIILSWSAQLPFPTANVLPKHHLCLGDIYC
jgi:hypothetical protein